MKTFELQRRRVAQRGMAAPRVVPAFNELEHGRPRLSVRGQGRAGEQLALERREEVSAIALSKQSPTEPIDSATSHSWQRAPKASDVYWQPWSE